MAWIPGHAGHWWEGTVELPYKPAFAAPQELESVRGGFNDSKRLAELRVTFYLVFFFPFFFFLGGPDPPPVLAFLSHRERVQHGK